MAFKRKMNVLNATIKALAIMALTFAGIGAVLAIHDLIELTIISFVITILCIILGLVTGEIMNEMEAERTEKFKQMLRIATLK